MSFVGVLPLIIIGLVFGGLGYFVWKKAKWWALLPFLVGLITILYAFSIYSNAKERKNGQRDYFLLEREIAKNDLIQEWQENPTEENLYFISLCSQALYRVAKLYPGEEERIFPQLRSFAEWVVNRKNFTNWNRKSRWAEEAFFLAHAGIILGHYQELTEDESFASDWQDIANYVQRAMRAARYKNLISRTDDDLMRPADNAALLYMLSLYDRYHATEYNSKVGPNWLEYLDAELKTGNSHLPCSAFTNTNTCRLEPTASALGMCLAYLGAAGYDDQQQLYREWLHGFKVTSFSPIALDIKSNMLDDESHFCDLASFPIPCEKNLDAIAFWLAAEYNGDYTYSRLLSERMIDSRNEPPNYLSKVRPDKRIIELTEVIIRVIGQFE